VILDIDMIDVKQLTIEKAHEMIQRGELTSVELASECLKNIKEKNEEFNIFLEVYDDVLEQAKRADIMIKEGKGSILTGVPIAIKDNILIAGKKVSSASKMLENYKASYDAFVIKKLKKAGVVLIGRTNMDEFAMGGSTENSAYGPVKNPINSSYVPGGSSGGSAAAVASGMALGALGSDTGGSIRTPASFCGLVGMKPTYGITSRFGLTSMASSLDQIGPFAKTAEDARIIFENIRGKDEMDSTSVSLDEFKITPSKKIIGVPWNLVNGEGVDLKVQENFKQSIEKLKKLGFKIKDIYIKNLDIALAIYYIIMPAEASTNLSRFDGVRYGLHKDGKNLLEDYLLTRGAGFGKEVRRRILLGTYVLSAGYYDAYYGKAQIVREVLRKEFIRVFQDVDLIVTPTAPFVAWKIGEKSDPLSMYLADIFTVTANIVGVPAISIPSGFVLVEGKKLPLGIQFMAPHGGENLLFEVGKKFEEML